jgi:hypothetical protein
MSTVGEIHQRGTEATEDSDLIRPSLALDHEGTKATKNKRRE